MSSRGRGGRGGGFRGGRGGGGNRDRVDLTNPDEIMGKFY